MINVNDIIELDCGYHGMIDMQPCRVLEQPYELRPLFEGDKPSLAARVEQLGTGETFLATLICKN